MNQMRPLLVVVALATACTATTPTADPTPEPSTPASTPASTPTPPTSPTPDQAPDPRTVEVQMAEWAITLSTPRVRPGRVTFVISNPGTRVHGFEIKREGPNRGGGGSRFERESRLIEPGETIRFRVTLDVGEYEIECYVGDHDDRGMRTRIRVERGAQPPAAPPEVAEAVAIEGFSFEPPELTVDVGTTVTWTNRDPARHTATAAGAFDSGNLDTGATFSTTFDTPGRVEYICTIHPSMTGAVIVQAA